MDQIAKLGNIELVKIILTCYYHTYGYQDNVLLNEIEYQLFLKQILIPATKNISESDLFLILYAEAVRRELKTDNESKNLTPDFISDENFRNWQKIMFQNPTYIREITPLNLLGNRDIVYAFDETIGFDYPVREACQILFEKGYRTYWSSANRADIKSRKGEIIKDKSVAYILLSPENLTEELKSELELTGNCELWGIASNQDDDGKYYGIYAEIESEDTLCNDIKCVLIDKANALPVLRKNASVHV